MDTEITKIKYNGKIFKIKNRDPIVNKAEHQEVEKIMKFLNPKDTKKEYYLYFIGLDYRYKNINSWQLENTDSFEVKLTFWAAVNRGYEKFVMLLNIIYCKKQETLSRLTFLKVEKINKNYFKISELDSEEFMLFNPLVDSFGKIRNIKFEKKFKEVGRKND